jgi:hypothetical protein
MRQYNQTLQQRKARRVVDLPTIYKIIEVAAGIKLNDPNALAAALAGQS